MNPSAGDPSASSSQKSPSADTSETQLEVDAQETDQGQSSISQPPSHPPYYTRSAARRLPPPSPDQIRAGKLVILNVDHDHRPNRPRSLTVLNKTTTSQVKPPVPPAQPSPSGIVPLGPPPPREPRRASSPPPPAAAVGRFDHLPPPSLSFPDAWRIMKEFVDDLEKVKDELDETKLKELMLAFQGNLGLPPDAALFEMFESTASMVAVIDFVSDYFETSGVPPADDDD